MKPEVCCRFVFVCFFFKHVNQYIERKFHPSSYASFTPGALQMRCVLRTSPFILESMEVCLIFYTSPSCLRETGAEQVLA